MHQDRAAGKRREATDEPIAVDQRRGRIAGAAPSVSPFLVLFAVFFWAFLWGIPGAFIGVPIVIAGLTLCEQRESTRWVATLLSGRERS